MVLLPGCKCCGGGKAGCDCCPNGESISIALSVDAGSGSGFDYDSGQGNISYESKAFSWTPTLSVPEGFDPCTFVDLESHDPGSGEYAYYSYGIDLCPPFLGSGMFTIGGNAWTCTSGCYDPAAECLEHVPTVFDQEAVFVRASQELFSHYFMGAYWYAPDSIETSGWAVTLAQTHDIIKMQRLWQREEPQVTIVCPSSTGKDAAFTPVFKKYTDGAGQDVWQLESVTVTNGGSGYNPSEKNDGADGTVLRMFLASTNVVGGFPRLTPVFSAASAPASITGVTLTTTPGDSPLFVGKQGYLQAYSRSEPTITATAAGGVTLSVTLQKHGSGAAAGTRQPSAYSDYTIGEYWEVASLAIKDIGTGPWGGSASVSFNTHGAFGSGAQAYIKTKTTYNPPPSVTVTPPAGGSGATLGYTLTNGGISAISVTTAGDGYSDGDAVTISVPSGYEQVPASATVVVARANPNLTPYVWGDDGTTAGSGAIVTATMNETTDWDGKPAWEVASLSIVNGGSGYEVGEYFWYEELDPGIGNDPPYYVLQVDGWWITSVDGNGAITGIGLDPNGGTNGLFYKLSPGPIASVTVNHPGVYYKATETPDSVVLQTKGKYYNETFTKTSAPLAAIQCDGEGWEQHDIKLRLEARPNPDDVQECEGFENALYYIIADNVSYGGSYGTVPYGQPQNGQANRQDRTRSVQDMTVEIDFA